MINKIVFIDIDGTLFDNENDKIHQSSINAIEMLKRNGVYVCIASGRSKVLGDEVFSRYDLDFDGYVLINGQYVILKNQVIYKNPLDKKFINEYKKECDKFNLPYGFMTADKTFVSSHEDRVTKAFKDFKMNLPNINTNEDFKKEIYQGMFFDNSYLNYFSQKFKQYVKFISWLDKGADIISNNSSKAVGIEKICEKLNVKRENVYAFGDSINDIEMIKYANIGIAMGNSKDELKKVSDYVTDNINDDGLYNALKKFKLI